ncbi:hypothetical protein B0T14DRAFT_517127 [Immersiella caudata]|uniref:Heterokaryon incompatibility domain-containing protein n=1 Tax=Immersiella caudata TaxID=314043 RepID=A0AA40C4C7_9PEZI|nr:hypothetical protein B0T14DRAFT_517127 [Immersiella caudata]
MYWDRDLDDFEMKAFVDLLHRRCWSRVWVVQELFMAGTCYIQCGSKIVTRQRFNRFISLISHPGPQFEDPPWGKARAGKSCRRLSTSSGVQTRTWASQLCANMATPMLQ